MPEHNVIIGGGPVATNAIETIRHFDGGTSSITLVSDEPAHSRMVLPYWLAGQVPRDHTLTGDDAYFARLKVDTRIGVRVTKIDPKANTLGLSNGGDLSFDKLLIATGSSPTAPPIEGTDQPGVQPLWTLDQTQSALDAVEGKKQPRVVMLGAGFIGFIMLNAMVKRGWKTAVVEREAHVLPRMLNAESAAIVESWLKQRGVDVYCGTTAQKISGDDSAKSAKKVSLSGGASLDADLVIVATGVGPNDGVVAGSTIKADGGILVNDRMQTNVAHVYAGGDVARGPVLFGNGPEVHAIQPTAVDHGRVAGANMAGQDVRYPGSLSMNILDVCGLQCASFGNWADAGAEAMTISNPNGLIYRTLLWTGDQITGAIFIGRPNDMGMLTDVGMVKGIMQTRTALGPWKNFLAENPFDVRRPYVAAKVASKLATTTLLGRPAKTRQYQFKDTRPGPAVGDAHAVYVGTKKD